MKIERVETNFSSNCYIIYIEKNAYIIDPSCSLEVLDKYLNGEHEVKAVLLTHAHIDHIYYLEEVIKKYNCCVYLNKNGLELLNDANKNCSTLFGFEKCFNIENKFYKFVNDNDYIDGFIKAIYTPGHTSDSLCYLIENELLTGDTLFNKSIGRTDLYSGDYMKIVRSIKNIYSLGYNYNIYPGHGLNSTLNDEKQCNFYVKKIVK